MQRVVAHGVAAARIRLLEAVHAVFEKGLAVGRQGEAPQAEGVAHAVAAVAGLDDEVAFAPRADGLFARQAVVAPGAADDGIALRAAVHGDALHGVDLDVVDPHDARREVVMGADDPGAYDVVKPLRAGVAQFVVEVRPHRRAAVARIAHHVALLHGPGVGAEPEVYAVRAAGVALFAHALLDVLAEALQVAVYGGRAVVQREVDGAPVAVGAQAYARDVAVGHGHEGFALGTVGFDVDARVEMPGAHLAEIGRVEPFDVADRVYVLLRGGVLSPGPEAGGGRYEQYQNSSHVSVSVTSPEAASTTVS